MTARPRIEVLANLPESLVAEISAGRTSGLLCPACEGGRSGERSLSAYGGESGLFGLKCHRAGCGYSAGLVVSPALRDAVIGAADFKPRPFRGDLEMLSVRHNAILQDRYGITSPRNAGVQTVSGRDAIYIPVYGPNHEDRGGVVRFLDGSQPKTVSYLTTMQPRLAWYAGMSRWTIVVVEDQLSAMRCAQLGYYGVALMGTNLNTAKVEEIMRVRSRTGDEAAPVLLALDKDAFSKAVGYARRWPSFRPVLLEHDIKDSDDADVLARLEQAQ